MDFNNFKHCRRFYNGNWNSLSMGITFASPPQSTCRSVWQCWEKQAWFEKTSALLQPALPAPLRDLKWTLILKSHALNFFLQEKILLWRDSHNKRKNGLLWDYVQSLFLLASFSIWRWYLLQCRKIHRSWNENFDIKFPFLLNSFCLPDNSHLVWSISLSFSPDLWLEGFYFCRVNWEWVHS